jgi:hypothetical protein
MAHNKLNREDETREVEKRVEAWRPPELLPSPDPEEGYAFRWIRVTSRGVNDPTNTSSKLREGWVPVKASDHPEVYITEGENPRFPDCIVMGGLMLCKMPAEMVKQRNAYYEQQARSQITSVDNNLMRESDPRMPLFNDRASKVTFGNGT